MVGRSSDSGWGSTHEHSIVRLLLYLFVALKSDAGMYSTASLYFSKLANLTVREEFTGALSIYDETLVLFLMIVHIPFKYLKWALSFTK